MKILSTLLFLGGCALIIYAVFSRFYGQPSVALTQFRSLSMLMLANTLLLLSLIAAHTHRYLK